MFGRASFEFSREGYLGHIRPFLEVSASYCKEWLLREMGGIYGANVALRERVPLEALKVRVREIQPKLVTAQFFHAGSEVT